MKCLVRKCRNDTKKKIRGVTFHRLPQCPKKKQKWLELIGFEQKTSLTPNSVICSIHFEDSSFQGEKNCRRGLKKFAIPKLLLGGPNVDDSQIEMTDDSMDLYEEQTSSPHRYRRQRYEATNRKKHNNRAENANIVRNSTAVQKKDCIFESFGSTLALQLEEVYKLDVGEAYTCMQAVQNLILNKITTVCKKNETGTPSSIDTISSEAKSISHSPSKFDNEPLTNPKCLPSPSDQDIIPTPIKQKQLNHTPTSNLSCQYSTGPHSDNPINSTVMDSTDLLKTKPLPTNSTNIKHLQLIATSSNATQGQPIKKVIVSSGIENFESYMYNLIGEAIEFNKKKNKSDTTDSQI